MNGRRAKSTLHLVLIVGFLAIDFLFFHDAFKPGETISPADWLVGALSLLVFVSSALALVEPGRGRSVS
jgi:hypothetical protein